MRLIHKVPFSPSEIEHYRQLIFDNLTRGLRYVLDAMEEMDLKVEEQNNPHVELVDAAKDIRDNEPFPQEYLQPLKSLWEDPNVQKAWERGNEAALPEKYASDRIPFLLSNVDQTAIVYNTIFLTWTDYSSRHINRQNKILFGVVRGRLVLLRQHSICVNMKC